MNKVIFSEKDHKYTYNGEVLKSVSQIFKMVVEPEQDWDYIAGRSVLKKMIPALYAQAAKEIGFDHPDLVKNLLQYVNVKEFNELKIALRKEWKDNSTEKSGRGTAFHKMKEQESIDRGYEINREDGKEYKTIVFPKTYDNESVVENLYDLGDGFYPELLVFNIENKVVGQIDKAFISTVGKDRFIDIDDYKTDAEIKKIPSFRHPKKGYEMMKSPFSYIYNTNYTTYMLKISMYAWILEQAGFKVRGTGFTSVEINDNLQILNEVYYPTPYKRWEVENILKIYNEKFVN